MRDGGDDNSTFVVDPLVADTVSYDNVRAAALDGVLVAVSVVEVDDKDVGPDSIDVDVDVSLIEDDSEDVALDVAVVVAEDDILREGSGVCDVSDDAATDDCARVDDVLPPADDGNDVLILLC